MTRASDVMDRGHGQHEQRIEREAGERRGGKSRERSAGRERAGRLDWELDRESEHEQAAEPKPPDVDLGM